LLFNKENDYLTDYILSKKLFVNDKGQKISGTMNNYFFSLFIRKIIFDVIKTNIINIEIKDVFDKIENFNQNIFFHDEIFHVSDLIHYKSFKYSERFTCKLPNNNYLIFDRDKKILIIRYGNYDKYNLTHEEILICQNCNEKMKICSNDDHNQYRVNCFKYLSVFDLYTYYPAEIIEHDYEKLLEEIDKLTIISYDFYEFVFDKLLNISKKQKDKNIQYFCFKQKESEISCRENFSFQIINKEKELDYSFDQIHFKHFGKNVF